MDDIIKSPKVFISYAWDTKESDAWVKKLATDLRDSGIDVILDKWKLAPGDRMPLFMETSIRDNDYVVIICTPKYKLKSENRLGGVGYEGDIMTAEVSQNADSRKFIPILQSGYTNTAVPGWLSGKYYIDFTDSLHYESDLENLIQMFRYVFIDSEISP
ncbi:MAG: TIR domain-containing protein, partial [Sphingobacteriaceae bacterium]